MGKTNTAIVLMSVMAMILMTAIPAATAGSMQRSTGMRVDTIHVEFVGDPEVESLGKIPVIAQVFNNSSVPLVGAYVNLTSNGGGSFVAANGVTNATGVYATVFNAPNNPTASKLVLNVTAHVNKTGFANFSKVWEVTVYPMTNGTVAPYDADVKHLVYETTFEPASGYLEGSYAQSGIDFLGNIVVKIDGVDVQVSNFSLWEKGELNSSTSGLISYNLTGYYYYSSAVHGIVYMTTDRAYTTDTGHYGSNAKVQWFLPALRTYNISTPEFGDTQVVVNTYKYLESGTFDGEGFAMGGPAVATDISEYVNLHSQDVTTFMGTYDTEVFLDREGMDYEYFAPDLSILLKEVAFDQTGNQISTRSLIEYNDLKIPEPLPVLIATVSADSVSLVAGTSTLVHVVVTNGTAPVAGATVKATVGQGGTLESAQGISGADGKLELTFAADIGADTVDVDVNIVANKTGYQNATATTTIIVLKDITPPFVSHRPFETAEAGVPLKIEALAGDDAGVNQVILHYRVDVPGTYLEIPMTLSNGVYSATIPAEAMVPPLVEYWLSVSDINGNGVALPYVAPDDGQFDIHVLPTYHIVGPVSVALANGGTATISAGVRGDMSFNLTSVSNPDAGPVDTRFMGLFANIRAIGSGTLEWANISFTYTANMLGKLNEQELQIYWWDTQGHTWMSTDHDGVIADQDLVWANVSHLTIFAPRALTVPVITQPSDTTVPTVSVVYPSNLATMTAGSFKLVGQASDDRGLFSVQVQVDNGAWVDVLVPSGAKSAGWVYDLSLKDGKHTIVVRAKDQAGNLGTPTTVSLTVKKETTEKENGVTMTNVIGAIMALIIVVLVVLLVFFIRKSSTSDKGPAKPEKEIIDKDEEE
jgi:hypothetical protein